ncbi:hypothetical protein GCM10010489_00820 [Microbacterium saperdae]|uniref:Sap-like sulfolipid-1-addressing protein n=2 Tax=Microbacterium saperdae TaxID=69368 RepID=A0A543BA58_9MICO|nr:GAP family protein [Microbacterium saperdae]TQL81672.1 Sap-like sulfolipid-1-addressing protein [Microbacterium saperdae]GGM33879.1 hypothetical protein GCM10010489_00820 [Microbacterium saperdae]
MNPMNIALVAAAAISLVVSGLRPFPLVLIVCGFLVAAALPVAAPVLTVLIRGDKAEPMLRGLKQWMLHHNGYLSAAVLFIVGVLQVVKAIQGS